MNKAIYLLLCGSLAALWADQVVMKNGDRISGSIVKKEKDTLTIKSEHFGLVALPWSQVDSVQSSALNVVLANGTATQSALASGGERIDLTSGAGKQSVAPGDIAVLRDAAEQRAYERLMAPRLTDLWLIQGSLNLAGTVGNAKTSTFTTPWNATRVTNSDKLTLYFNAIRASARITTDSNGKISEVTAATAQAVRGGWAYNRNLRPRLFWNAFNDYEFDRFQNLDLRVVLGSGLGFVAWKGERGRLDLLGGAAWNREKFDPIRPLLPFSRNSAEGYWGNDFTYKLSSRVGFFQGYRMFTNLRDSGAYRQNFDAGITAQLTKWLAWNAAVSDRYLSRPVAGRKNNDFIYTTGFGFSFAR